MSMDDRVEELLAKDPPLDCGDRLELDAGELFLFPTMAFARNPRAQWKHYPFMGCLVLPRAYR
jgi:hypothetical protein